MTIWRDRLPAALPVGASLLVAALLSACGGVSATTARSSAARTTKNTTTGSLRIIATGATRSVTARKCSGRLGGGSIPGWRMGAVQFFSANKGVGVTAGLIYCYSSYGENARQRSVRQPIAVATTSDGGRWWRVATQAATLVGARGYQTTEQLAATSARTVWALIGSRVYHSVDAGRGWQRAAIAGPVVQLVAHKRVVWALSCVPVGSICRPELWRTANSSDCWVQVSLPEFSSEYYGYAAFAIAPDGEILLGVGAWAGQPHGALLRSTDGRHWSTGPAPVWYGNRCWWGAGAMLTAAAPRTFFLLCIGGAAAGSSTKALLRSTDGGASWRIMSAVRSLTTTPAPGGLTRGEPDALAAGSGQRVWLSDDHGIGSESDDAGRTWSFPGASGSTGPVRYPLDDPYGVENSIAVLNSRHAWCLAPGIGLWRTIDGVHWQPDGPLNRGGMT